MNTYTLDEIVKKTLAYLKGLPDGTEISTSEAVRAAVGIEGDELQGLDMFEIHDSLERLAYEEDIFFDGSRYRGQLAGRPCNIPYVLDRYDKREVERVIVETSVSVRDYEKKTEAKTALIIEKDGSCTYLAYPSGSIIKEMKEYFPENCEVDDDHSEYRILRRVETKISKEKTEEIFDLFKKRAKYYIDIVYAGAQEGSYAFSVFFEDGSVHREGHFFSGSVYFENRSVSRFLKTRIPIRGMKVLSTAGFKNINTFGRGVW
ncbi:MAG: hypothetical protein IKE38_00395 [Erysipelotrichaceae bacterium]|nr:hypothetical protein [Erysipelotrichaceae bacterium]